MAGANAKPKTNLLLLPSCGHFIVVSPDDDNDLEFVTRYVEVGTPGVLVVVSEHGDTVELPAMEAGHRFDIRVKRIKETDTTADLIVAYF